jgi:transposase-like protein
MAKTRAPYPPGYRPRIVGLARSGRSIYSLAATFNASRQTITNWIRQAERDAACPVGQLQPDLQPSDLGRPVIRRAHSRRRTPVVTRCDRRKRGRADESG